METEGYPAPLVKDLASQKLQKRGAKAQGPQQEKLAPTLQNYLREEAPKVVRTGGITGTLPPVPRQYPATTLASPTPAAQMELSQHSLISSSSGAPIDTRVSSQVQSATSTTTGNPSSGEFSPRDGARSQLINERPTDRFSSQGSSSEQAEERAPKQHNGKLLYILIQATQTVNHYIL